MLGKRVGQRIFALTATKNCYWSKLLRMELWRSWDKIAAAPTNIQMRLWASELSSWFVRWLGDNNELK